VEHREEDSQDHVRPLDTCLIGTASGVHVHQDVVGEHPSPNLWPGLYIASPVS